jgi:enediyne biosynthesis protein E4
VIEVRVGSVTLRRTVMPTRGYLSQSELPVTIGLGDDERPDEVRVRWPDG